MPATARPGVPVLAGLPERAERNVVDIQPRKPICDRGGHQQDYIGTMRALALVARPHYRNPDIVGEEQIARLNKADQ
jgi:hypothetical protein